DRVGRTDHDHADRDLPEQGRAGRRAEDRHEGRDGRRLRPARRAVGDALVTSTDTRVREALAWLARRGSQRNRDGMARYAIVAPKVFGVSMSTMQTLAKRLGKDHALAAALWKTGWYEARILTSFVDEPERVTPPQMERWARDFDNWAICDTI